MERAGLHHALPARRPKAPSARRRPKAGPSGSILAVCLAASLAGATGLSAPFALGATAKKPAAPAKAAGKPGSKGTSKTAAKAAKSTKASKSAKPARKSRKPARPTRKHAPRERAVAAMRGGLPNVQAAASLVIDLETGRELFRKNPDGERPIASISKLAAMLTVLDRKLDLDGHTTISRVDVDVARGGARSRLLEGMTLTNRDLLHAAMLGSDNRAVPALGRAVGLSPPQLAAEMTKKARSLGLQHTRFEEPTGLSPRNVSTPREVVLLLQAAMSHPILGPVARTLEYEAHPLRGGTIKYVNTHRPALRGGIEPLGGKTGFNNEARYCLVYAARVNGRPAAMCFLGTEGELTRFGDVSRVAQWMNEAKPSGVTPSGPTLAKGRVIPTGGPIGLSRGEGSTAAAATPQPPAADATAEPAPASPPTSPEPLAPEAPSAAAPHTPEPLPAPMPEATPPVPSGPSGPTSTAGPLP